MARTTLNLDHELAAEAREALGAKSVTEAIHIALGKVVRQHRLEGLADQTFPELTPAMLDRLRGRTPVAEQ